MRIHKTISAVYHRYTMNKKLAHLPYRPCVGIALFNRDGLVFVGERVDTPGAWQMPQGGIDHGEGIINAVYRELREEIGTDKVSIIRIADEKLRYDLPEHLQEKLWSGRYRGQEQTWVAAEFTGENTDIDLNTYKQAEFNAWEWVDIRTCLERIVPFKRDVYQDVIRLFADLGR
jgi:putative (di)nucleoside polyphosphate hydrolase